ncbi:hypothetical protein KQI86_15845 [Clostridium sp. MSJ-11]|uniref:Uncharacterized protein n=1 Tax=Clostridium mobile TaxID=2841512 RepID=A0ABS6EKQ4_9CLOT|nr:hypothetical protein [Clostridium mobile]MBU5485793.1 hypothetical protein [Clostridium mobile]
MKEIKKDIISVDRYEEDNRCNRPGNSRSDRCGEIRIKADTVNIRINCRS